MLKVDPWTFFVRSDRHATEMEFPHYLHASDILVLSSYDIDPLSMYPVHYVLKT